MMLEKERESRLPPWKRGREFGALTSSATPIPGLSAVAGNAPEVEREEPAAGPPPTQTASKPARATPPPPVPQPSSKKFRFLRTPPCRRPPPPPPRSSRGPAPSPTRPRGGPALTRLLPSRPGPGAEGPAGERAAVPARLRGRGSSRRVSAGRRGEHPLTATPQPTGAAGPRPGRVHGSRSPAGAAQPGRGSGPTRETRGGESPKPTQGAVTGPSCPLTASRGERPGAGPSPGPGRALLAF
ncbi:hypothetical protein ANANG_G00169140 [Anguilla anguilla]|uniref:Uncharacterized protein n=1 Tax=Anguilla anguilla TaxID=7936 RepID=A0A9D3M4F3_ANGAN|nr:hypothetical protein ANANG_G00169140 [Anguilla anguilla]